MRGLLVFGRNGQVATELASLAPDATFLGRDVADLTDPAACAAAIRDHMPLAVINAAAYTAVDRAETEEQDARLVNAEAPTAMAQAAAELRIPFLHISSDYVFNGSGSSPWRETDATGPLGIYGATKLAGEQGVASAGGAWAVLRTSWVFSAHGSNFVKTMLKLAQTRDALKIVDDQIGGPTPARAIAESLLVMADKMQAGAGCGLYHFAGSPDVSWAGFASEIFTRSGHDVQISPIPTKEYPTPAKRPLNSRLDCSRITNDFGIPRPDWRLGLDRVLAELETSK